MFGHPNVGERFVSPAAQLHALAQLSWKLPVAPVTPRSVVRASSLPPSRRTDPHARHMEIDVRPSVWVGVVLRRCKSCKGRAG